MTTFTSRHVAKRRHFCAEGHVIEAGQPYLRHVATPNDNDLGNTGWWHMRECVECATRYGRGDLVSPQRLSDPKETNGEQ